MKDERNETRGGQNLYAVRWTVHCKIRTLGDETCH